MNNKVVWVHEDCLAPNNPALTANPGIPAVFVFDDAVLTAEKVSLKRVMFIYECLLEMPVTIRRGDTAEQVLAFAAEYGHADIVTTKSIAPRFDRIAEAIGKGLRDGRRLEIVPVEPFVAILGRLDLKRFSRYWGSIKHLAFGK